MWPVSIFVNAHFYPRSPCGERHPISVMITIIKYFYPRSPCGERHHRSANRYQGRQFLSTLSLRRATGTLRTVSVRKIFLSTLSLRRATQKARPKLPANRNFYPRSPCGERPGSVIYCNCDTTISIHALLAESDLCRLAGAVSTSIFLSTLSLRRATQLQPRIHPG